jgi:plastocyanin
MKKSIVSKSRILIVIVTLFGLLSILNGCSKSSNYSTPSGGNTGNTGNTGQGTNAISIQGYAFSPASVTVSVNSTITWTNKDPIAHTVTSDGGSFDSGSIGTNGTFSHTFATAGTFTYHCNIHPMMTGTVMVQ